MCVCVEGEHVCWGAGEMCLYVAGECVWGEREGGGGHTVKGCCQ